MSVDVLPLGAPELGMTRAEILEYATTMLEIRGAGIEMFYTLLFAYVVAMYLAGNQLTRAQYTIANIMYLAVIFAAGFSVVTAQYTFHLWSDYAGLRVLGPASDMYVYTEAVINALLISLSIWFGRRIRHPATE